MSGFFFVRKNFYIAPVLRLLLLLYLFHSSFRQQSIISRFAVFPLHSKFFFSNLISARINETVLIIKLRREDLTEKIFLNVVPHYRRHCFSLDRDFFFQRELLFNSFRRRLFHYGYWERKKKKIKSTTARCFQFSQLLE